MSLVQQARERRRRQRARHDARGGRLKLRDRLENPDYRVPAHRSFLRQTRIDVNAIVFLQGSEMPPLKRSIAVMYRAANLSPNTVGPLVAEFPPEAHGALWEAFQEELAVALAERERGAR